MLPQVDSLPGSECKLAASNGHGEMGRRQHCTYVSRHVIGTLVDVGEEGVSVWNQTREEGVEILPHIGVGVFLDDQ